MTATTRIGTCNIKVTLSDADAEQVLHRFLNQGHPDLVGILEWDGPKPDKAALNTRRTDDRLRRATEHTPHKFARPRDGGSPQVYNAARYHLLEMTAATLVGAGFVGHLPGRKSTLQPSVASVGIYKDVLYGGQQVVIAAHLTAEVQKGRGYRTDLAHRARVRRHKRERAALGRLVRKYERTGRPVSVVGDTNYDGMVLPPLVSCWVGHKRAEQAGTLGGRSVDYVFAADRACSVQVIPTKSDHDGVVAVYVSKEK